MGKALVIKGLNVPNPLDIVTFMNADNILSAYLSANSTISDGEKSALKTFVTGIIDAGLWNKMLYFYPMLGNQVSDMLLEVLDQSTEDIFTGASTDGLSINSRMLRTTSKAAMLKAITTQRLSSLDMTDLSIIGAYTCYGTSAADYSYGEILSIMRNDGSKQFLGLGIDSGAYRFPFMRTGINEGNIVQTPINSSYTNNQQSYKERILNNDYNGNTATLYKDKTSYSTGTNYPVTMDSDSHFTIRQLLNSGAYYYDMNALIISKHLSVEEWGAFYDVLLPFLQAVGKHA